MNRLCLTFSLITALLFCSVKLSAAKECLECHPNINRQMEGNSHHVQETPVQSKHCHACHWEATDEGKVNALFHQRDLNKIDLVIWRGGKRPTEYKERETGIIFSPASIGTASERVAIAKITRHCLSCHSDENNTLQIFAGDANTPRKYAWDRQSIASRYAEKGVTRWGKYSSASTNKKMRTAKSFSAHGNAAQNQGGWSVSSGYDSDIPLTRGGSSANNVECFDCHNSHGSTVSGVTSSYRSFDGTFNGGILKETLAGTGGYSMTYKPSVNFDLNSRNPYNSGAGLCFDCHETAGSGIMPWGYSSTYGAQQPIMGYKDTLRFDSGKKGSTSRFAGRQSRAEIASSHLKAGLLLNYTSQGKINGLCTPCHDPHGISRTLGENMSYAVPLLKGTWLTSPYKEDVPPASAQGKEGNSKREANAATGKEGGGSAREPMSMPGMKYNVDRNTFDGNKRITETVDIFGGLCLGCHSNIKPAGESKTSQLHRATKGWGSNKEHSFPCSKCHQAHNSGLQRLMQTNCFEQGPSGLRENSGLSWTPDKKDDKSSNEQEGQKLIASNQKNKKSGKGSLVGCHVRQFGRR